MSAAESGSPSQNEDLEPISSHGPHYAFRRISGERDQRQRGRAWAVSRLRFLQPLPPEPGNTPTNSADREVLLAAYEQVGATWRSLTDVRFKLLALLPVVSIIALTQVLKEDNTSPLSIQARLLIVVIGAIMSGALWIYDTRNNELYDELISRGRRIEAELGIHTGAYLGRPVSWHKNISHRSALAIVYGGTLAAWLVAIPVVLTS